MATKQVDKVITEYVNHHIRCAKMELESLSDACFCVLAYVQALRDVNLINQNELNNYYHMLTDKIF
jgi:hypothetical protein